ncbi:MAG: four helix bundle protein [Anaerolineales bacterium]
MKAFKFENLTVWQMALEYVDLMYHLAERLAASEQYNLASQLTRAATSIALNIAEGSTGQSDSEQKRFLGLALRSLIETVACQRLIERRKYISDSSILETANQKAHDLARALQAFRNALGKQVREEQAIYLTNEGENI